MSQSEQPETPPLWDIPAVSVQPPVSSAVTPSAASRARAKKARPVSTKGQLHAAAQDPVARIVVDIPLAHLDRTFDYQVPEKWHEAAVPGCRVRVRFAGKLVDGYLLERASTTEHKGKLSFLERVTSSEVVLSPETAKYCRAVAQRYGGSLIDILRLAIPTRHAKAEDEPPREPAPSPANPEVVAWNRYRHGPAFLGALQAGRPAHAVWQALPGEDWPLRLAEAAATVAAAGRGAVLVVPDQRDVVRLHEACVALMGEQTVVALYAGLGPAERYRRWLAVSRGQVRVVVGTRAAMFAPVANPGLFVVWDDGDDLHIDQHMPYPQVRDVLIVRAHESKASLVVAGYARTAEAQLLVESGWAHSLEAERHELRAAAPRVTPLGEDFDLARDAAAQVARLPAVAFEAARASLANGAPVLIQVPRRGYVPALACAQCRTAARCRHCAGPMGIPSGAGNIASGNQALGNQVVTCRWCGVPEAAFRCTSCGSTRLRAVVIGAKRTADELGRAFTGVRIRTSGAAEVLASVPAEPALVVCTPGAEPIAAGGYGAALLLDGWALLGRPDLRAAEETLRRWMAAAALVRPAAAGGRVIVGADGSLAPVQTLVRWDPVWHADKELSERQELGFPPAVRMASAEGTSAAVAQFLDELSLPEGADVLGPVPLGEVDEDGRSERERAIIRVPRTEGKALAAAVAVAQAARVARKELDSVRVQLDPLNIV